MLKQFAYARHWQKKGKIKNRTVVAQDPNGCPKKYVPLFDSSSLTVSGLQGPKGDKGDKGDVGPQGPKGEDATIGLKLVTGSSAHDSSSPKSAVAECPAGYQIISGWGSVETGQGQVSNVAVLSYQRPSLFGTSFAVSALEHIATGSDWRVVAYAMCRQLN
jgi:hypothetical protein